MFSRYKRLTSNEFYRNVFTLISAISVAQGIAFLIYPILTRIYTPEEHGIFSIYMSIIAITSIVSTGKYELAVLLPKDDFKSINLVFLSFFLSLVVSLFLLILIILFNRSFSDFLGNEDIRIWLYLVPLSTLLVSIFQILSFWSNRHKRYSRMAGANVSQSVFGSVIKISSSGFLSNAGGLIIGTVAGQALGIAGYLKDILIKDKKLLSEISFVEIKNCMREYKLFPKFSLIHYLVNNFSSSMPVFAIGIWFSTAETGVYSLAFLMINRPVTILTSSFLHVFSQKVVSKYNEGKEIKGDVNRFIRKLLQLGIAPFIVFGALGPVLFPLIFGEEWSEAGRYIQILLPWMFVVYLASSLSFLPDMLGKQKFAMWIDIIKFAVRVIAIALGIYFTDIYLMLICFSFVSTLIAAYSLYWYFKLAGVADKQSQSASPLNIEVHLTDIQDIQSP